MRSDFFFKYMKPQKSRSSLNFLSFNSVGDVASPHLYKEKSAPFDDLAASNGRKRVSTAAEALNSCYFSAGDYCGHPPLLKQYFPAHEGGCASKI